MIFVKKKNIIFLAVLFFSLIFFVGAASAATINVNPGTGTIQSAVTSANSGDTLNLSAGTYYDHNVTLNKNLIIQGPTVASGSSPTAVIDGQNTNRIFNINTGVTVTLKNLLLQKGETTTGSGGAINNLGKLTVTSCEFDRNVANNGGAIYNYMSTCTVTGSSFNNNIATNNGGAINNYKATCTITDSTFNSNSAAASGGVIYNYFGTCTITGSTFTENTAGTTGGAINNDPSTCTVTGSTFTNNTAGTTGGAIYNSANTCTVTGSTFTNNTAGTSGGAIYNSSGTCKFTNSVFNNNSATDGGAITNTPGGGSVTVTNSILYHNTAIDRGGAIYNYYGKCTVTGSYFTDNSAHSGGAILNEFGTCTFTSSAFNNNNATDGGAIDNTGNDNYGNCTFTSCTFTSNTATTSGGAINNEYGNCNVTGSTFTGNTSDDGGAIYNREGKCTINNSSFVSNTATTGGGGAIDNYNGTIIVTNTNFTGNNGVDGGAIINHYGGTCTVTSSTFTGNFANTTGGAIYNYEGTCIITSSTFTSNSANDGGAIYNENDTCTITSSTFTGNVARFSGGAIRHNAGSCTVTGTTFTGNSAGPLTGNAGGAIVMGDTCTVTGCNFMFNISEGGKSIINFNGDSTSRIVNYNRFYGGTSAIEILSNSGSVDAKYNWWGSNLDPASKVSAGVDVSRWLVLNINASPSIIKKGAKSTITVDLNHDNTGATVAGHVINGIPITLITTLGSINSPVSTVNGAATATLNSGSNTGIARIFALLDSQLVNTSVKVIIDNAAPVARSASPARNAVNVPLNTIITTTFNEPIKAGNMQIQLKKSNGNIIPITTSISGNVLTVTPVNPLIKGTKYTLILNTGSITDLVGNPVAAYSRSFTTDATAPKVIAGSPARDAVNIPIDTVITTTFNEPIKAGTMSIQLVGGGTSVPFTTSISGNVLTVTPTIFLTAGNVKYTLTLQAGSITDLAGNPIALYSRPFYTIPAS